MCATKGVDGPVKPGHDGEGESKSASSGIKSKRINTFRAEL
jgi:hypothetical protein